MSGYANSKVARNIPGVNIASKNMHVVCKNEYKQLGKSDDLLTFCHSLFNTYYVRQLYSFTRTSAHTLHGGR